jgi:hypothetical protein
MHDRSRADGPGEDFDTVDVSIFCEVAESATSQNIEIDEKQANAFVETAHRIFGFIQTFRFCQVAICATWQNRKERDCRSRN